MKVFNLSNDQEAVFLNDGPEWAVAFLYCEDHNLKSALFNAQQFDRLDAFYKTLPFVYGRFCLACGDWVTMTTKFKE